MKLYFTPKEAADLLRIDRTVIYRQIEKGKISCLKNKQIPVAELDRYYTDSRGTHLPPEQRNQLPSFEELYRSHQAQPLA